MDTSKEYIKMCDCPEIQNKVLKFGDFFLFRDGGDIFIFPQGCEQIIKYPARDRIWLPRQDQLQEMVIRHGQDPKPEYWPMLLFGFTDWAKNYAIESDRKGFQFPTSMEQLWLAFVMKEKFGKKWDGDKWIS